MLLFVIGGVVNEITLSRPIKKIRDTISLLECTISNPRLARQAAAAQVSVLDHNILIVNCERRTIVFNIY